MAVIGFYAGSFDPFTNGHLAIVKKASKCFNKIIIGLGDNQEKPLKIEKEKMKKAICETLKILGIQNVEVIIYNGLTVDAAKKANADILIRGLRNGTDYQYEENIAQMNEKISNIDTCYFRAGKFGYLSSSVVMEMYKNGKDIKDYVPEQIEEVIKKEVKE